MVVGIEGNRDLSDSVEQVASGSAGLDINRFSASLLRMGTNVMYAMAVTAVASERLLKICCF